MTMNQCVRYPILSHSSKPSLTPATRKINRTKFRLPLCVFLRAFSHNTTPHGPLCKRRCVGQACREKLIRPGCRLLFNTPIRLSCFLAGTKFRSLVFCPLFHALKVQEGEDCRRRSLGGCRNAAGAAASSEQRATAREGLS